MPALSPNELELAKNAGFDPAVCGLVKEAAGGAEIEKLAAYIDGGGDAGRTELIAQGVCLVVPPPEIGPLVVSLRDELARYGCRAFRGVRDDLARHGSSMNLLVLLRGMDDHAMVRVAGTSSSNFGVTTQDIVDQLDAWTAKGGKFTVLGAWDDTVDLAVHTIPGGDACAFAVAAFDFCEGALEQAIASLQEEDDPQLFAAARALCPGDIPELQELLVRQRDAYLPDSIDWELEEEYAGIVVPGIKILACKIQQGEMSLGWNG